ncbi:hypothetical protein [Leptospira fluminis]|uniref:hypothetical protein n=1 Tax=Leptospira fluminis TaxID=2484979 RepID=UPI00143A778F|nr:hypothetical protein [Leptospira fluminis]
MSSYFFCVTQTKSCMHTYGNDCFAVKNHSDYFAAGGNAEGYCLGQVASTKVEKDNPKH